MKSPLMLIPLMALAWLAVVPVAPGTAAAPREEVQVVRPADGQAIDLVMPQGGVLQITLNKRYHVVAAKVDAAIAVDYQPLAISLSGGVTPGKRPASGSIEIELVDGRKITFRTRAIKEKTTLKRYALVE